MSKHENAQVEQKDFPVVIIGGSLVGLATSMFLGMHGIPCIAIEKHRGTAIHPRAGYFQLRTLEMMRQAGIEEKVIATAHALYDPNGGLNAVETLAGREIKNYIPDINQGIEDLSPSRRLFMPQQELEPIIKDRAAELGSQFLYSHEVTHFEQDDNGVSVTARNIDSKQETQFKARFLVACDGCRSPVRKKLNIQMHGHPALSKSVTIYFKADCSKALRGRNLGVIYVNNPKVRGFFRLEKTGMGGFLVIFTVGDISQPEARNSAHGIDESKAIQFVRDSVGDNNLEVDVLDIHQWEAECHAAERFQEKRIFIAGDAAHVTTPTGGFGGNTGVQDAHNLAWKLAFVLNGLADETLLKSYNAERQPSGKLVIEQAYNRYVTRSDPDIGTEGMEPAIADTHVEYNRYRSSAVVHEDDYVDDDKQDIDPRKSFALPGTRAPHIQLLMAGKEISSLDLFGKTFVLLTAAEGTSWAGAKEQALAKLSVPLEVLHVQQAKQEGSLVDLPIHRDKISSPFSLPFQQTYGISLSGAVLIRPDGYVAWKQREYDENGITQLVHVLRTILSIQ